ncbi:hypothetical protein L345_04606, partial [Ophiophagus hannah]
RIPDRLDPPGFLDCLPGSEYLPRLLGRLPFEDPRSRIAQPSLSGARGHRGHGKRVPNLPCGLTQPLVTQLAAEVFFSDQPWFLLAAFATWVVWILVSLLLLILPFASSRAGGKREPAGTLVVTPFFVCCPFFSILPPPPPLDRLTWGGSSFHASLDPSTLDPSPSWLLLLSKALGDSTSIVSSFLFQLP